MKHIWGACILHLEDFIYGFEEMKVLLDKKMINLAKHAAICQSKKHRNY